MDEDTVVFKKLQKSERYDQGTVTFRARKGKLIDLLKLHESIWATRLSGGTRSGLVSLDVTAIGRVVKTSGGTVLKVDGSDAEFVLAKNSDKAHAKAFAQVGSLAGGQKVRVTGRIDNYRGRWPNVLKKRPAKTRRILVMNVELQKKDDAE